MYELAILLHPDLEIDLEPTLDELKEIITDSGGQIENLDVWGKRKLTYKIQGEQHAIYTFFTVKIEPGSINQLEEAIRMREDTLRYLIVRARPEKAQKKAEQEEE